MASEVPRLELNTRDEPPDYKEHAGSATSQRAQPNPKQHERKSLSKDGIHYVDGDDGVEPVLDSRHLNRVEEELEKLNIATDVINKLELQLDDARMHFRKIHASWLRKLEEASRKYETAITKSRPYYAALADERRNKAEAQESAVRFERANSLLQVAKQHVQLTEESLMRQGQVEPECLDILNHHVQQVRETKNEYTQAEEQHRYILNKARLSAQLVRHLEKESGHYIKKSKHYFDLRYEFQRVMQSQTGRISMLENDPYNQHVKSPRCICCAPKQHHYEASSQNYGGGAASSSYGVGSPPQNAYSGSGICGSMDTATGDCGDHGPPTHGYGHDGYSHSQMRYGNNGGGSYGNRYSEDDGYVQQDSSCESQRYGSYDDEQSGYLSSERDYYSPSAPPKKEPYRAAARTDDSSANSTSTTTPASTISTTTGL